MHNQSEISQALSPQPTPWKVLLETRFIPMRSEILGILSTEGLTEI